MISSYTKMGEMGWSPHFGAKWWYDIIPLYAQPIYEEYNDDILKTKEGFNENKMGMNGIRMAKQMYIYICMRI